MPEPPSFVSVNVADWPTVNANDFGVIVPEVTSGAAASSGSVPLFFKLARSGCIAVTVIAVPDRDAASDIARRLLTWGRNVSGLRIGITGAGACTIA